MVLIVPANVRQSVSFRKIQGYLFYWFQNQCIKIQEKEGRQKKVKKKEFFGCGKLRSRASVIFLSLGGEG